MSKYYSAIATVGAVALLLGAALQITQLAWAPYLYLIGAIMFAYVQVMSGYEGKNIIIRRLRRQQIGIGSGHCACVGAPVLPIGR